VAFVKQANIAHGPQQVNNATPGGGKSPTRGENPAKQSNELLEVTHGQRLDTGTAGAASGTNPHMEAVDALHRTPD